MCLYIIVCCNLSAVTCRKKKKAPTGGIFGLAPGLPIPYQLRTLMDRLAVCFHPPKLLLVVPPKLRLTLASFLVSPKILVLYFQIRSGHASLFGFLPPNKYSSQQLEIQLMICAHTIRNTKWLLAKWELGARVMNLFTTRCTTGRTCGSRGVW